MATKVYGCSDDLIEIEGDISAEGSGDSPDSEGLGTLVIFDDGTLLDVCYGKPGNGGVWQVTLVKAGTLFDRIDQCDDEDAEIYSDIAHFKDGLKRAWFATSWEQAR